jgi:subtilase family serine protease
MEKRGSRRIMCGEPAHAHAVAEEAGMAVEARLWRVGTIAIAVTALLAVGGSYAASTASAAAGPRPQPRFAALPDSVGATAALRTGAYASPRMSVELTLAPRDRAGLASALRSAYTEGSAGFHRWLARGQFDARYGPAAPVRAEVVSYLRSAGLTVVGSPSPFLVRATGSSRQVQSALRTSLSSYRTARGVGYYANSAPVRLPAAIAPDVLGVTGLTNTARLQSMLTPRPRSRTAPAGRKAGASCEAGYPTAAQIFSELPTGQIALPGYGAGPGCSGLTPSQANSVYGAPRAGSPRTKGAGETLGLFELSAYQESDIRTWTRHFYGPRYHAHLININVDGGPLNPVCPAGDQCPADFNGYSGDIEVDGDIEADLTYAPDASRIEVYDAPGDTTGQTYLDEYAVIANQDTADVVSASWATCEDDLPAGYVQAENEMFEQMALQGQSMFSGSGDWGPFSCVTSLSGPFVQSAIDPAAQPWVTGTGGTSLESYNPGMNPHPRPPARGTETVWNVDSLCSTQAPAPDNDNQGGPFWCAGVGAGGGGPSQYWGRPFYQHGPGVSNPAYPNASGSLNSSGIPECVLAPAGTPCRETPDVSADADEFTGYAIYCTGTASLPESTCATFSGSEPVPGWFEANGTSLTGPQWASITADRDSYLGHRSGNINPWLYYLLRTDPRRYFHDITGIGPRQRAATSNGMFPSTPGYDMATGVGTPEMAALITGRW